jgi:CBS domain-containing protein
MSALSLRSVSASTLHIPGSDPWHADPNDPALRVMTDFRERASVTVSETDSIDAALEHMKHTGVRCAFVVDSDRHVVVGMITAYDISSEKPMRLMQSLNTKRSDILVRDLMQRMSEWRVLHTEDLERSTVAALGRLFDASRLTHIPVMEKSIQGETRLRGLLSSAKIKRLLTAR